MIARQTLFGIFRVVGENTRRQPLGRDEFFEAIARQDEVIVVPRGVAAGGRALSGGLLIDETFQAAHRIVESPIFFNDLVERDPVGSLAAGPRRQVKITADDDVGIRSPLDRRTEPSPLSTARRASIPTRRMRTTTVRIRSRSRLMTVRRVPRRRRSRSRSRR